MRAGIHPRIAALAFVLLLVWCAFGLARAQDFVPVPPLKARVTDVAGTLSSEQVEKLEASLAEFEKRKGAQIAVLIVPTTKPETIEQYSIRVAEAWKVGRKGVDDGLILIVAVLDRQLRIEVGYGLEGVIPDAVANRVIGEIIVPRFRAGDIDGGIRAGVAQLMKLIDGEQLPPPPARQPRGEGQERDWGSLLIVLFVGAIVVGSVLTAMLGRFVGSLATGGLAGFLALGIVGSMLAAVFAGLIIFIFTLVFGAAGRGIAGGRRGGWGGGPWTGGGGGWSSGSGNWSGGGGGFGGGGASGRW